MSWVALHPISCASWGMWPWSRTARPLRQPSELRRWMDKWIHFRLRTPLLNIFGVYIMCIYTSVQNLTCSVFGSPTCWSLPKKILFYKVELVHSEETDPRGFCVRSWRAVLEMPKCSPPPFRWEIESWTCPLWCFAYPLLTASNLNQHSAQRMIECEIEIQWFQATA